MYSQAFRKTRSFRNMKKAEVLPPRMTVSTPRIGSLRDVAKRAKILFCIFYVKPRLLTRWAAHFAKKGQVPIRTSAFAHTIWQHGSEEGTA
ncbi:hypothetical protein D3C73_689440 [compost metagenome]